MKLYIKHWYTLRFDTSNTFKEKIHEYGAIFNASGCTICNFLKYSCQKMKSLRDILYFT